MRLAYINPQPIPGLLPSTIQALQVVDGLAAAGAQVTVITPLPEDGATVEGVLGRPLHSGVTFVHTPALRKRWFLPYSGHKLFYWKAAAMLRQLPVDAVYVRNLKLAEALFRSHPGLPLFFETHELFAQSFVESGVRLNWRNRRKLKALQAREAKVYAQSTGLVAITHALADDIRSTYSCRTPILVAPDGVDLPAADAALASTAARFPPIQLLYLGSLHKWKGVEILVDALPFAANVRLTVAGGNPQRIAELKQRANARGIADRIDFLGPVPPVERFDLIRAASCCLLPLTNTSIGSRYTSPLKLFEYMAMGKPVIASDLPAVGEVLSHGENGYLVAADNPAAWAMAIEHLLGEPALCESLGRQARADARAYGWAERGINCLNLINASESFCND